MASVENIWDEITKTNVITVCKEMYQFENLACCFKHHLVPQPVFSLPVPKLMNTSFCSCLGDSWGKSIIETL